MFLHFARAIRTEALERVAREQCVDEVGNFRRERLHHRWAAFHDASAGRKGSVIFAVDSVKTIYFADSL